MDSTAGLPTSQCPPSPASPPSPSAMRLDLRVARVPSSHSAETSPSSCVSLFTVHSASSFTSVADSDNWPPSPLNKAQAPPPPSVQARDAAHAEPGLIPFPSPAPAPARKMTRSMSLSAPGPQRTPPRARRPVLPHAAKTAVGNGTVRLVGQPTHAVASALASAAQAAEPIQHLHLSATWGSRLPDLLEAVLPTIASSLLTLDISECGLGQWPHGLRACTKLEALNVSGNVLLGNPPLWLSELTALRALTLDKIGLTQLPSECITLQALERLSLTDNQMVQPPLWLYQLPHLRELQLENNPLYQPWSDMLAPVIQSSRRASAASSPSTTSISLELPEPSRSRQPSASAKALTCAPSSAPRTPSVSRSELSPSPSLFTGMASSSFIPSPRKPERLLSVPPKSEGWLMVPSASTTTLPSPPVSPKTSSFGLGRRFTAKLRRAPKTSRAASCPGAVPEEPSAGPAGEAASSRASGSSSPSLGGKDYFSLPTAGKHRSISGPAYEESDSLESSSQATEATAIGPFDPGWPGLRPSSDIGSDPLDPSSEKQPVDAAGDLHARRVRTVLQYLRDLDELSASLDAPSEEGATGCAAGPDAPLPLMGLGRSMAQARPDVAEQVAALQRVARDDAARRKRVVIELISSEQTYVQGGLEPLVAVYVRPLASLVPAAQHKLVFSNVESLLAFHQHGFLPALTKAAEPLLNPPASAAGAATEGERSLQAAAAVGRVFVEHAAFLRMYAAYINSCDVAQQIVMSWGPAPPVAGAGAGGMRKRSAGGNLGRTTSVRVSSAQTEAQHALDGEGELSQSKKRAIQKHLKRAALDPRTSALGLESYLLLPIQRIPRYRLLLEELLRCVPVVPPAERSGEEADEVLAAALASVLTVAKGMNEAKRFAEQEKRMYAWQEYFSTHGVALPHGASLVQPHRRLLKEGRVVHDRLVRPGQVYARTTHARSAAPSTASSNGLSRSNSVAVAAPRRPPRGSVRIPILNQDMVRESVTALLCNDLLLLLGQPLVPGAPHRPGVQAYIALHSSDQISSDGPTVRVRDAHHAKIFYLTTSSEAEAHEWVQSFRSAVLPASKTP